MNREKILLFLIVGGWLLQFVHLSNPLIEFHSVREVMTFDIAKNFYLDGRPIWEPLAPISQN